MKEIFEIYFRLFHKVYVELTQPEMPNNTRHVDFKINTKAAGFPYRYSMIVSQINCDLPSPNKGI